MIVCLFGWFCFALIRSFGCVRFSLILFCFVLIVRLYACAFVGSFVCLFACLFVCWFVPPFVRLFFCYFVLACWCVHLFVWLFVCLVVLVCLAVGLSATACAVCCLVSAGLFGWLPRWLVGLLGLLFVCFLLVNFYFV